MVLLLSWTAGAVLQDRDKLSAAHRAGALHTDLGHLEGCRLHLETHLGTSVGQRSPVGLRRRASSPVQCSQAEHGEATGTSWHVLHMAQPQVQHEPSGLASVLRAFQRASRSQQPACRLMFSR